MPDPLDIMPAPNLDPRKNNGSMSGATLLDVQELGARHLDMSAHVVSSVNFFFVGVLVSIFFFLFGGNQISNQRNVSLDGKYFDNAFS